MGCLRSLLTLLILGLAGVTIVEIIMGPWILTVGGRQRYLPIWEGVGDAQGSGGTYRFYVWFAPTASGQRILPEAAVEGYSVLCTPHGERFNLKVYGGAPGHVWRRLENGHEFNLRLFRRVRFAVSTSSMVADPRLQFVGHWRGPDLVMDDQGSLSRAFNADGSLHPNGRVTYSAAAVIPITFAEHFWGLLSSPACPNPTNLDRARAEAHTDRHCHGRACGLR